LSYVITPLGGVLLFDERVTLKYVFGMTLIVVGVLLASRWGEEEWLLWNLVFVYPLLLAAAHRNFF